MPRKGARAILASLGAAGLVLPIAVLLASTVHGTIESPLAVGAEGWTPVPIDIPRVAGDAGGAAEHRLRLAARNVSQLAAHSEIRLLVATHLTSPVLDEARLSIAGTNCAYHTAPGAHFPNNETLRFIRGAGCAPLRGVPTGTVELALRFRASGRPALWTFVAPAGTVAGEALVVADAKVPRFAGPVVARGALADEYSASRMRRSELLAYMWQVAPSDSWIWAAVILAGVALAAGLYHLQSPAGAETTRGRFQLAFGAACAALAVTGCYAVLVPPFQAADEPHHFLGFAAATGRADVELEARDWFRRSHLERIHFDPQQRFGPSHIGRPGAPWDGNVPDPDMRGAGVEWVWRLAAPLLRERSAPAILLALRTVDAVIFSACVGVFMLVMARWTNLERPQLLLLPLFYIPTLPFFATYVSNHAVLASAYVLVAAGVLLLFLDAERPYVAGWLIGVGWAAAILISRSAIPLAAFLAAMLAGRVVLSARKERLIHAAVFWLGATAPLAVAVAVAPVPYLEGVSTTIERTLSPAAVEVVAVIRRYPVLLPLVGILVAAFERSLWPVRDRIAILLGRQAGGLVRVGAALAAVAAMIFFAGSLIRPYPVLPLVDRADPPLPAEYAREAVRAGLTLFRFGAPDWMTSVTFWGGFGWLETTPPEWFVSLLAAGSGVAFVLLLAWLSRARAVRQSLWLLFALVGYSASLALYGYSVASATPADLHGRYLLGLYLCAVSITWSSVALTIRGALLTIIWPAAVVSVHAYSFAVILRRYF